MDFTKINELMEIKKKSEASKEKKQLFHDEMMLMLNENGIDETALRYIKDGFTFCGSEPLAHYIKAQSPSKYEEIIDTILSLKIIVDNDKNTSYRILLSLLGHIISLECFNEAILGKLIKQIPMKARVKDGSIHKDVSKVFEKHFLPQLSLLSKDFIIPPLEALDLMPGFVRDFKNFVKTALDGIEISSKTLKQGKETLVLWVFGEEGTFEMPTKQDICDTKVIPIGLPEKSCDGSALAAVNPQSFKLEILKSIEGIEKYISETEKQNNVYKIELLTEKEKTKRQQTEIGELQMRIAALTAKVSELSAVIADKDAYIAEKEMTIQAVTAEIERLKSIISVYSDDKQLSQNETLNSIASKLKQEYRDFLEAENMEMTIDLGENLRDQINSIFKILMKSGIDIKGR